MLARRNRKRASFSHVAASVQVRHCLGMRATMQVHSAPADCGGWDGTDLPNSTSDLQGGVSGLFLQCQPSSVSQPCTQSQNPAMSNLREFYQRFNSLDTSPASYYHQIPVGWFKQLFPTSQFAFWFANNEPGIWVKLSIRSFSQYATSSSSVHMQAFGRVRQEVNDDT